MPESPSVTIGNSKCIYSTIRLYNLSPINDYNLVSKLIAVSQKLELFLCLT